MFKPLSLISLLLTLCLMAMGTALRVSDAGLGCPDWPGCLGEIVVDALPQAQPGAEASANPLAEAHRYLAGVLIALLALMTLTSAWARQSRLQAFAYAGMALVLAGLQGAADLFARDLLVLPVFRTLHLLAGALTAVLLFLAYLSQCGFRPAPVAMPGWRWFARLGVLLLLAQMLFGWWASLNHAGLACPDFPTCLGSYSPPVDYAGAFAAPLHDSLAFTGPLSYSARAAIHWTHRIGAVLVFLWLTVLAMGISSRRSTVALGRAAVILSFLLLVEISLGAGTVLLRLPVAVVALHGAVSLLLLLNVLFVAVLLRAPRPAEEPMRREEPPAAEPAALEAIPPAVLPTPVVPPAVPVPLPGEGLFERLKSGLGKTRGGLTGFLANLALGKKAIDRDLLEDIEAQLLMADIGVTATAEIIADLTDNLERSELKDVDVLTGRLREHLFEILEPCSLPLEIRQEHKPFVILVVGVNGVGKTTTIGKLARRLQNQGLSVMLAAGDTFRAAAVEQLQTWGERNGIPVIAQHTGADSASVIFDGVQSAQARGVDVLIADTAGRLHTKSNLMEELSKIKRIMGKLDATAPHEVLLVLDAGTGQNALSQAKQFNEAVGLTGLALTKLDGTAKGGVIFALAKQFGIPIRYIGVGEGIDDLQDFKAREFIDALFASD